MSAENVNNGPSDYDLRAAASGSSGGNDEEHGAPETSEDSNQDVLGRTTIRVDSARVFAEGLFDKEIDRLGVTLDVPGFSLPQLKGVVANVLVEQFGYFLKGDQRNWDGWEEIVSTRVSLILALLVRRWGDTKSTVKSVVMLTKRGPAPSRIIGRVSRLGRGSGKNRKLYSEFKKVRSPKESGEEVSEGQRSSREEVLGLISDPESANSRQVTAYYGYEGIGI